MKTVAVAGNNQKLKNYLIIWMGRFRATDRPLKIQDYWVPLIRLYMGLRPSEACQLKQQKRHRNERDLGS